MAAYGSTMNNHTRQYGGGTYRASSGSLAYAYTEQNARSKAGERVGERTGAKSSVKTGAKTGERADKHVAARVAARPKYFYDTSLLCAVIFVFALGCLIIYSSSQYTAALEKAGNSAYYFKRQLFIGGAGILAAAAMSFIDYRLLEKAQGAVVQFIYWLSNGLLVYTLIRGITSHGKARWINIFGIQFQPTEVAKAALIIWVAWFISTKGRHIGRRENIMKVIAYTALPFALILKQNISSAVIVALIAGVMLFVAVKNEKAFVILGGLAALGALAAKPIIGTIIEQTGYTARPTQYWLRRILGWAAPETFPDDAYQTLQSLYAIGSGGIRGHGLGESIQKFGKLPEAQNDMIFAIVCEEFGFIGAAALILLFMYLIYRIYQIAKNASDLFGTMLCTGVMAHLGIQAVLNIAVVTGVIPNTGVTLPFISYGGSAVFFTMCEIGIVLSVAHRIPKT